MVVRGALDGLPDGPILLDSGAGGITFRDSYAKRTAGTIIESGSTIRLGNHSLSVQNVKIGSLEHAGDVVGIIGLGAIRNLVMVFPAGSEKVILGFPK